MKSSLLGKMDDKNQGGENWLTQVHGKMVMYGICAYLKTLLHIIMTDI